MIGKGYKILNGKDVRWFDIIEISGENSPISFKNNRIHSMISRENRGYGIRVNSRGMTGFSHTNDPAGIEEAAERASGLARYGEGENFNLPSSVGSGSWPFDERIMDFNTEEEVGKGYGAINSILADFPGANIDMGINRSTGFIRLINSNGIDASYRNSYYSVSISVTLINEDGSKLDVWESISSLYPADYDPLLRRLVRKINWASKIRRLESGRRAVILTPKAAASMLGILSGGLNGRSVSKGTSPFTGKLGEKIFNDAVTLYDNPLIRDSPFSYPFDDEGVSGQEKILIEKGVIKKFIADLKFAEKLGIEPTGNGSRGYGDLPSPGFSNRVFAGGLRGIGDIIADIDTGILVDQFIGLGQSNTLTGDFSAGLDLAYLIEKGEITGRVKDCMITDNLFKILEGEIIFSSEVERISSAYVPYMLFPAVNYTG